MDMIELKEFLHTNKYLIYTCFSHMITNNFYTAAELSHILDTCVDNQHLFYRIGKTDHDSVFTRSFSSLTIAAVLNVNVQGNLLTYDHVKRVSELLLKYLYMEQDVRGLVNEQGLGTWYSSCRRCLKRN